MHEPTAIANYFIRLTNGEGLTLMQMLKLSYLAHGFKMGIFGKDDPLSIEYVQAWKFGPVFPSLYHEFKYEPPGRITAMATRLDERTDSLVEVGTEFKDEEKKIMDFVYGVYGGLTGAQLSALTHQEGTPWHNVWYEGGGKDFRGVTIPNEKIADYFRDSIINKYTDTAT